MADFKTIKANVGMLDVLRKYGLELRRVNSYTLKGKCPLPSHTSEADRDSFTVNTKINGWVCHSSSCVAARNTKNRDGKSLKKGGDLIEFVQQMEKAPSLRQAGECLETWFGPWSESLARVERPEAPGIPSERVIETYPDGDVNKPLTFVLRDPNPLDPYLHVRGFEEEECEFLGVGFFRGKGLMENRIVFPIHNEHGELIAYAGRSADREIAHQARWKFPPGFMKSQALYNLHRVEGDEVFVFEGFWGVLAAVRAGIMNTVAIMGTSISEWQAEMLAARFRKVNLVLDGDEYGREAIPAAIAKLVTAEVETIEPILLPKGLQPDETDPDTLRSLLRLPPVPDVALTVVEDHPYLQAVPASI